MFVKYLAC